MRYNTPEFEQTQKPEFNPQKFAENIRAAYTETIIKELPPDLYECIRQEFASIGVDNKAAIALRVIAILAKEYTDHKGTAKTTNGANVASTTMIRDKTNVVTVYTDGACEDNPGPGGWSAIVILPDGSEQAYTGGEPNTTNNRMELMAPIAVLESLAEPSIVTIYSDAKYVVDGVEKGWARSWRAAGWIRANGKQPALNPDLWGRLLDAIDRHKKVTFQWIKGHAGNPYNERCDKLAVKAAAQVSARKAAF
jgi:ribonuclease HI